MSHSVKDRHPFEKHVESTLLLVAIHRCKICNFYSSQSRVIYDHIRTSHAAIAAEDGATSSAPPQLEEPNTPLKSVLKEIQNLDCFRTIPSNQVTLKILSDSRTDDYGRCWTEQSGREVVDPQLKLSSFYDFLIRESTLCTHEKSPEDTANLLVKETLEGKQFKEQLATSQELDSAQGNSILDKTQKNVPEEPHARAAKTENDVSHTCTASATKQDFNRAYESWMEEGTIVKKKVRKKTKEKEGEILAEQNVIKARSSDEVVSQGQAPRSGDGPVQESPLLSTVTVESGEISKTEKAARSCQEKIPQDDVPVQSLQSGEASMDASAVSLSDGNVATSSGDKEHGQTLQGGTSLPTQQLPPMKSEGSKLYGGVDFQGIAQRASQSNPEATTITVVQHTGGNRPPMTIHFKKSAKSEAIIPTGESLGIESPFLRKEYSGSKIFACKECHSRYKTANELDRHVVKKHQKKKSYLCEICGDALATRSGMKTHIMRKHAVTEVLSCNVCDYMTRSSARLTVHMKKHNKDTSEFYCEPCKKSFVTESKLQQHKDSPMHKNAVDPIICEHCGYVTKKRDNFLVHLRKHTGEKPYRCNHCKYAAADGSTLKRHVMARHSSIRPFRCTQCQFSCVDKKGLTVHMRKHTGERPYQCEFCPYTAKRSGALTVHRRTHFHNKASVPSPKEDLTIDGSAEVASYVDISDIPVAHVPLASLSSSQNYPAQLSKQNPSSSIATSVPQGITTNQANSVSVQLPPEVISTQETDQSVRTLW